MSGHCESLNVAFARKKFSKIENEKTKKVSIKILPPNRDFGSVCAFHMC